MKTWLLGSIFAVQVLSHSWLDCIGLDIPYNGPDQFYSYHHYDDYCIGYPRGYPGRYDTTIGQLYTIVLEGKYTGALSNSTKVCGDITQRPGNYSQKFPMTRVEAGKRLKFWYEMDGHRDPVTHVNIYSYGQPGKLLETYGEQLDLTPIDKPVFATAQNCMNLDNTNTWCWSFFTVPSHWQPGVYSFLWNWPWDRNQVGEDYNTCFDIEVLPTTTQPGLTPIQPPHLPTVQPAPIIAARPAPVIAAQPAPIIAAQPAPTIAAQPAPVPAAQLPPTSQPAPIPAIQSAPVPAPQLAPVPAPLPAPVPEVQPAPIPASQPAPGPAPQPAPVPAPQTAPVSFLAPQPSKKCTSRSVQN